MLSTPSPIRPILSAKRPRVATDLFLKTRSISGWRALPDTESDRFSTFSVETCVHWFGSREVIRLLACRSLRVPFGHQSCHPSEPASMSTSTEFFPRDEKAKWGFPCNQSSDGRLWAGKGYKCLLARQVGADIAKAVAEALLETRGHRNGRFW